MSEMIQIFSECASLTEARCSHFVDQSVCRSSIAAAERSGYKASALSNLGDNVCRSRSGGARALRSKLNQRELAVSKGDQMKGSNPAKTIKFDGRRPAFLRA